ncbi:hypothetical protein, partial [Klebsiella pneumoniae]|uniref:hypothetical protein n=1 Tax=Klebsiella pneumoniae TaxID=573 RepID=UPI00200E3AFE
GFVYTCGFCVGVAGVCVCIKFLQIFFGGVGVVGATGDGWQVELGLREGERRGRWWPSRYGTAVKGDAAQDSAVFFNT